LDQSLKVQLVVSFLNCVIAKDIEFLTLSDRLAHFFTMLIYIES